MRKFFLMLFLANIAWACVVESSFNQMDFDYPAIEVNLFEENKIDYQKARKIICENKCEKNDDSILVYRSNLDTSLLVYLNKKQVKLFKMCYSVSECVGLKTEYDFSPIFSDVMTELNEKKLFVNSFDVDSLTEHILSMMLLESYDNFSLWGEVYNYMGENSENSIDIDAVDKVLTTGMICNDFCDYLDTLRQCPELTTTFIPVIRFQNRAMVRKISNSAYLVEKSRRNEMYRLYDLNGVVVNQGLVKNGIIHVRKIPAILEISNKRFLLK